MKLKQIFIILAAVLVVLLNLLLFIKNNNSENISVNKPVDNKEIENNITKNQSFLRDKTDLEKIEWKKFENSYVNFTFNYPADWVFDLKILDNAKNNMTISFNSEFRDKEMIVDLPAPNVGLELWRQVEQKDFVVEGVSLGMVKFKSIPESGMDLSSYLIRWKNSVSDLDNFIFIPGFDEQNQIYYKHVINNIINTIDFK